MARTAKKETALTPEEKLALALVPKAEQPYQVPENWCWTHLGSYIDYATDYVANGSFATLKENVNILKEENYALMVKTADFANDFTKSLTYTDKHGYDFLSKSVLYGGELILSNIGSIGKVFRVPFFNRAMTLASNSVMIKCFHELDYDWLYYFFLSPIGFEELMSITTGTAVLKFNKTDLKTIPLPVPPLAEQQRIVDRIENLFAKLDEAKEKAQAVVDGFEDRKAAILHKAFTGELTAEWRNTHGVSIDDWENAPLETVFQLRSGSTIDASEELEYGAIPYVKVADMNLPENEIQITTSSRFVDECPESHVILKGSTIFPKRGGAILTNKKRYVGVEKIIADLNTMAIMPIAGRAYGWYGYYWMQSVDLRQLNNGSNVPQINNKDMVKLFVPTPSIDEQKAIVGILDSVFDKEIEAKETAEQVIDQIDSMKKSILARAFRGELGTNDPADESAEELLKRIL